MRFLLPLICCIWIMGCSGDQKQVNAPKLSAETLDLMPVLPLPYYVEMGQERLPLPSAWELRITGPSSPLITQTYERTHPYITATRGTESPWTLQIDVSDVTPALRDDVDESYDLIIDDGSVQIKAPNGVGVVRAMSTLQQLTAEQSLPSCRIYDKPRYAWRGLMIDVARHFVTIGTLQANIDAMALAKMNVLHLHLSDNQAFRVESESLPKLHGNNPDELYYTKQELKDLVEYARLRGVRVVPGFDLPGHASPWTVAYPEMALGDPGVIRTTYGVFPESLDPTDQEMYVEVAKFIKEMTDVFVDDYIHIGADEVLISEWEKNTDIQAFTKEKSLRSVDDVRTYFGLRMIDIGRRAGKKIIFWDGAMRPELSEAGAIVQASRTANSVHESVMMGSPAIVSAGWTLDHRLPLSTLYESDPLDEPDYMSLEPDSTDWVAYDLSTGQSADGALFLFGSGAQLNGLLNINNRNNILTTVEKEGDRLRFEYQSASGPVYGEALLGGDEIRGMLALSVAQLPITGKKVGGHDMPSGMLMPYFTKPASPTDAQLEMILGGEALAWSEWVDDRTISRMIWPQALAVAEKLWSPTAYTSVESQLYRRVAEMDQRMSPMLGHDELRDDYIKSITGDGNITAAIDDLMDVLEPVRYNNRWIFAPAHDAKADLNGLIDVLPSESLVARSFIDGAQEYLSVPTDENRKSLYDQLLAWSNWYDDIYPQIKDNKNLEAESKHMSALAKLARLALATQQGVQITDEGKEQAQKVINEEVQPHGGVQLSVAPILVELVNTRPALMPKDDVQ